jgi:hypothetical protein
MASLIKTINEADQLAGLWRQGKLCALEMVEKIVALGFYAVNITERGVTGYYNGVRFCL